MRANKYRVWDKRRKEMLSDVRLSGMLNKKFQCDNLVFLQLIGSKDKNGVEIYESDIVSDGLAQDNHCLQGVFEVKFKEGGFYPFCISGWECTMSSGDCEVIGNTYENPELLP